MSRSYYSENFSKFYNDNSNTIYGTILQNDNYHTTLDTQKNAWKEQIKILKKLDLDCDRILFEYSIPRMGRRIDNILFYNGNIYLLEFKVGSRKYEYADIEQVEGYALDLKFFQEGSRNVFLVPILISTDAPDYQNNFLRFFLVQKFLI